jgi:hypothetical protein
VNTGRSIHDLGSRVEGIMAAGGQTQSLGIAAQFHPKSLIAKLKIFATRENT